VVNRSSPARSPTAEVTSRRDAVNAGLLVDAAIAPPRSEIVAREERPARKSPVVGTFLGFHTSPTANPSERIVVSSE
jgi:hypothetical protein